MTPRETPATSVDPSIAVVIMAYNRPVQILETIDSLLAQERSLSSIAAVYLADDCSKDNTVAAAMQRWTSAVPLTLLQPPKNAGTWGNVNHAIAKLAPKHDWVLLLHDDDMVKPNWLAMMCDRIRTCTPPTLTICSSWDSLHPDGATVPGEDNAAREIEVIPGGDSAVRSTLLRGCWWHFSGCAIRTRGFLDVGVFDPAYPQCADQDWLMRGLDRGWSVDYIPRTLLIYREHRGSLSSRSFLVHQDLVEQLMLVSRFGKTLSKGESLRFHLQLVQFALRRAVRAAIQRRPQVLINAVKLIPRCVGSWVRGPQPIDPSDSDGQTRHSSAVSA
jgi:GT2 family glycosyltransferase